MGVSLVSGTVSDTVASVVCAALRSRPRHAHSTHSVRPSRSDTLLGLIDEKLSAGYGELKFNF